VELRELFSRRNLREQLDDLDAEMGVMAGSVAVRPIAAAVHRSARRLDATATERLIEAYQGGVGVTGLAQQFGIHRSTVSALLSRHGVEMRPVGLSASDVVDAARLYTDGWSVAKLGRKFGVNGTTVWRMLVATGVVTRPASHRVLVPVSHHTSPETDAIAHV
jgi:hypothetical protein